MFDTREAQAAVRQLVAAVDAAPEGVACADWVEMVGATQRLVNQAGPPGNWSSLEEQLELQLAVMQHQHAHTAHTDRDAAERDATRQGRHPSRDGCRYDHHPDDPDLPDQRPTGCRELPRIETLPPATRRTLTLEYVPDPGAQYRQRHPRPRFGPDGPPPF